MLKFEKTAIMQESCNKGLNVLIYGIKEDEGNAWEKREATVQKFKTFLNDGLNINPDDIELVDIHRLPQYPIKKNGKTTHRPIIVKLVNTQIKIESSVLPRISKQLTKRDVVMMNILPMCTLQNICPQNFKNNKNYSYLNSKKLNVINNLLIGESLTAIIVCLLMASKLIYQKKTPKNVDYVNCNCS